MLLYVLIDTYLVLGSKVYAFTNDDVDRPWIVGREFESHVHHENAFKRKVNFLISIT